METKLKITPIIEKTYDVYENDIKVGSIKSHLELNDVCIQVKENAIENVYILDDNGTKHHIDLNGRVNSIGERLYTTIGEQLRKLI